ncbi:hypothetical protein COHA_000943 [Chlorella ohadii]|uniref:Uncharacterized protein n=1 Tax=Chlorella ohadii TaxID=2649997 RepID=A0AAD5E052_9CHLO|nr:hypothetical protein COHA_000943 [Chlorella ohadii]
MLSAPYQSQNSEEQAAEDSLRARRMMFGRSIGEAAVHHMEPVSNLLVAFADASQEARTRLERRGATAPSAAAFHFTASASTTSAAMPCSTGPHAYSQLLAYHLDVFASEVSSAAQIAGHQPAVDIVAQLGRWYSGDQLQLRDQLWLAFCHPVRYMIVRDIMDILGAPKLHALCKAQPGNLS